MSNLVDWLFSHIPWLWSTLIVIGFGILGMQVIRFNNFNNEASQVISRYGGLTPQAYKVLNRDSANVVNHNPTDKVTTDYMSHHYASDQGFAVSTYKTDKNGKVVKGATTSNFNGLANDYQTKADYSFRKNANGHYIKKTDGTYVFTTANENTGKQRYEYGSYQKQTNGTYVLVNGAYVIDTDKRLTTAEKNSQKYAWVNYDPYQGVNFVQNNKGFFVKQDGVYVHGSANDFKAGGKFAGLTRYTVKGNYPTMTNGDFKTDSPTKKTSHYIYTIYQTDDLGRPIYNAKGQEMILAQRPSMTTNFGGRIYYTLWINLHFLNFFNIDIPVVKTTNSQIRQNSLDQ